MLLVGLYLGKLTPIEMDVSDLGSHCLPLHTFVYIWDKHDKALINLVSLSSSTPATLTKHKSMRKLKDFFGEKVNALECNYLLVLKLMALTGNTTKIITL